MNNRYGKTAQTTSRVEDLSLPADEIAIRKAMLAKNSRAQSQNNFYDAYTMDSENSKKRWMQVIHNRDNLSNEHLNRVKATLGRTFAYERDTQKRMKGDKPYRDAIVEKKHAKYESIRQQKAQQDKTFHSQMLSVEKDYQERLSQSQIRRQKHFFDSPDQKQKRSTNRDDGTHSLPNLRGTSVWDLNAQKKKQEEANDYLLATESNSKIQVKLDLAESNRKNMYTYFQKRMSESKLAAEQKRALLEETNEKSYHNVYQAVIKQRLKIDKKRKEVEKERSEDQYDRRVKLQQKLEAAQQKVMDDDKERMKKLRQGLNSTEVRFRKFQERA